MIKSQINHYDSSTVLSSAYNYEHKILTVHFNHATYIYSNVDVDTYNEFANASSQGSALNSVIKGKFEFEKINEKVSA